MKEFVLPSEKVPVLLLAVSLSLEQPPLQAATERWASLSMLPPQNLVPNTQWLMLPDRVVPFPLHQ